MKSIYNSNWIEPGYDLGDKVCVFSKKFDLNGTVSRAELQITSFGVYEAHINGKRVGDFILAPGWTNYRKRLQFQTYDIAELIGSNNEISVSVGRGWLMHYKDDLSAALIASVEIYYDNGEKEIIYTDDSWTVGLSKIQYSNIYNGDIYDASFVDESPCFATIKDMDKKMLIEQQGEKIVEVEKLPVKKIFSTPQGDICIDFGQNMTGYVEFNICGKKGEQAVIYHAETLDADGNFYTANLRSAKQEIRFICDGRLHTYKPIHSFQGFRYIKLENWSDEIKAENFKAIVVHSDIKRTGYFECSDELVNKLYSNIIWGQRGNFLDVPTDCPQRDERLGWTGDAQVFIRTAALNFDVNKFFEKWLSDLSSCQNADGGVPHVIPDLQWRDDSSSGWADAAVICPWQLYLTYGNKKVLARQFDSMCKWVNYIKNHSNNYLWDTGKHFADWLCLDENDSSKKHATPVELISTAFFAYSTSLLIKSGNVLGIDMSEYEALLSNIRQAYRKAFLDKYGRVNCNTQTGCALTIYFSLSPDKQATAKQLNSLVKECGHLKTGFLGTPYLLHALSENGYAQTAYDLLLRREYPSWLYSVTMGATTIWEHWDSLKPDGTMWSTGMNSFNHYAYGAVGDWIFSVAAGINIDEALPGFRHIIFKPATDSRLSFVKAGILTKYGEVKSSWRKEGRLIEYSFTVPHPCTATVYVGGEAKIVSGGTYKFKEEI